MRVLSLGAGVQSSTLALMCKHGEIEMPDCAIFADTQSEPESVYTWLDWLETQLPFPVHRVTKGDLSKAALMVKTSKKSGSKYCQSSPPAWVIDDGETKPNLMMRQCTTDFKIIPIRKKLRELGGKKPESNSTLEFHSMKPSA